VRRRLVAIAEPAFLAGLVLGTLSAIVEAGSVSAAITALLLLVVGVILSVGQLQREDCGRIRRGEDQVDVARRIARLL
jgi:fumarate reductase subunit D